MNPASKSKGTALSRYVLNWKSRGITPKLKWSIKARASPYKSGSSRCSLCLKEKTAIAMCPPERLLNSRTEILHKCTHRREFELQSISRKCGKVHRDERHEGHAKGFLYKRKSSHIATIKLSLTLPLPACKKSLGNDVPGWDAVLLLHIRPPSLSRSIFEGRTLTAAIVCIFIIGCTLLSSHL